MVLILKKKVVHKRLCIIIRLFNPDRKSAGLMLYEQKVQGSDTTKMTKDLLLVNKLFFKNLKCMQFKNELPIFVQAK